MNNSSDEEQLDSRFSSSIRQSEKLNNNEVINLDDDNDGNNMHETFYSINNEKENKLNKNIENNEKEIYNFDNKNEENNNIEKEIENEVNLNVENEEKIYTENEEDFDKFKKSSYFNISIGENNINVRKEFIDIQEKLGQKELIGHIEYEISLIKTNKNEIQKIIKSYRRYQHFDIFYNGMKIKYPYFIYPKLSEKNVMVKINQDQEFMKRRRKQLKFFLNYLYSHQQINKTEEFQKFLNDAIFDEKYFQEIESPFIYPETKKYYNSINSYNPFELFKNLFKEPKNLSIDQSEIEIKFLSMIPFYNKMYEKISQMVQTVNNYYNIRIKSKINYNDLSRNLSILNLKKNFENNNDDNKIFDDMTLLSKNLSDIENESNNELLLKVNEKLDEFMLILKGICGALERYEKYIELYKSVIYAGNHLNQNDDLKNILTNEEDEEKIKEELEKRQKQYDEKKSNLGKEAINACKDKNDYEKELNNEYKNFISNYSKTFNIILNSLIGNIHSLNLQTMEKINNFKAIFED